MTLILGDNGSGKTSVLRSIALTALSSVISQSGFVPRNLVRRGTEGTSRLTAQLEIDHQDDNGVLPDQTDTMISETLIERIGEVERISAGANSREIQSVFYDKSPGFFVLGYGATRRVDMSERFDPQTLVKNRLARYQRVAGLFEDHIALVPMHSWFRDSSNSQQNQIVRLMNELMPSSLRLNGDWENGELVFEHEGGAVPFSALSDGFRGFIGLIGDILYHLQEVTQNPLGDLTQTRGVVLIDEIDLHLHPSWQRTVASTLSTVLPRIQFIFTTHSPIVVGTVLSENVAVLEISTDKNAEEWPSVQVGRLAENVHGLNADQILVSSYFGLKTTRSPDSERQLRKLELKAAMGSDEAAIEYLRQLVDRKAR